ncbi:MAG: hypothetical protein IT270_20625, partial [Saprospiraceae bacterium]|nr:hypothetical protein [Saprospiraceae bacterium]
MLKILLPLLCLFALTASAQRPETINGEALHFQLKSKKDTIDFIVVDTTINQKKPVFLFCQGSLPIPLFFHSAQYGTYMIGGGVSNFDLAEIRKHYHLVIISMPKTPVVVDEKNLDQSYAFIPDTANKRQYSMAYLKADYLENYQKRAEKVLKFLRKQDWVDNSKLVVAGHSQGAKVAVEIALKNKHVTHLGLFGANPFGRIDQFVRKARKDVEQGKISWAQADQEMESNYNYYREIFNTPAEDDPSVKTWKSFSTPRIDDWLKINIPMYLAYGTHDITSDLCDLVPLYFIQHGKSNLTHKRYLNMEHNFFEVGEDGRADHTKGHWKEVMQ